ncbi:MAG: hypothetical protein VB095_07570 [Anaerovorax sp.]|nr:hypothetical protein [Anaerovorax sp.]
MKIKCVIDKVNFKEKPEGAKTGAIINRMTIDKATEYSIEEIQHSILEGKTIRPSYCGGSEETWKSQQMFFIDIDNKPAKTKGMTDKEYELLIDEYIKSDKYKTYEQVIDKCKSIELVPNFVYTSFNHKPEHHKMRLVFILDKNITDCETAKKVQLCLMDSIGGVDEQCKNLNRIYYAGREIVFNSGNIINTDKLIELSKNISINKPSKPCKSKHVEKSPPNNNRIYNNSYIIRGTKTQDIVKSTVTEDDNYNIKAIANRDVEYLKKKINHPHIIFQNNQEFCDYIFKEIDLGELLEIGYPTSFRCLFHDDNNPSASIFKNNEGYWIYNCFGCGVSYNLLGVIEVLGKFKSRPKAYKFIRDIFNLEIQETDWQKEQKEILLENLKVLTNGELERNCPQAYKNISRNIKYLQQLILIAMDNVYNEKLTDNDDNVLFYASNKFIAKQLNINPNNSKEISKKTALMAYHKLLNKVDDNEANEDMLKRSKAININSTDKNSKYRHVNYYSIPSYNNMLFSEIEQRGQQWKENSYTIKGVSREMFYRAEGLEVANELYPQYKKVTETVDGKKLVVDRSTTKSSDERTNNIAVAINELIEEYGYATERGIVERLRVNYAYIITEVQIKKSLTELLDIYGWVRVRANKEIKSKYNVDAEGYPFLIVKNI